MILFVNVMFEYELFQLRLGFSYQKIESREGLDIALMASFTPRIGISILWCSHTITIDENRHNSRGYHNHSKMIRQNVLLL